MSKNICIIAVLLVTLAAVSAEEFQEPPWEKREVPFYIIDQGSYGIANLGLQGWTTGNSNLLYTWRLLMGQRMPASIFDIDLDNHTIIIISLGSRPTGGYSVEVDSVWENEQGLTVHYREITPKRGAMVTQALTAPYLLGVVPGQFMQVQFIRQDLPAADDRPQ